MMWAAPAEQAPAEMTNANCARHVAFFCLFFIFFAGDIFIIYILGFIFYAMCTVRIRFL